jgi:hypothetical protein
MVDTIQANAVIVATKESGTEEAKTRNGYNFNRTAIFDLLRGHAKLGTMLPHPRTLLTELFCYYFRK